MSLVSFERLQAGHKSAVLTWLLEPHVIQFWDNTPEHKADILNFIGGRKTPSAYANGEYVYWIASMDGDPFALLMSIKETDPAELDPIKASYFSNTGSTYSLEYMIGNPKYVGKGLGASTLKGFIAFFQENVDPEADTFFIDPSVNNQRARKVYEKSGFVHKGDFLMTGSVSHAGILHHFMVKKK